MSTERTPLPQLPLNHAFSQVFGMLAPQMAALDAFLRRQVEAFEPEIREMADYCIDTSGKRIRPALVFLSGWRGAGVVKDELVRVAAVVELVHLATLVHDDIMDGAEVRRSRRTAAKAYGPTAAVLLGDALFAHALFLATQFPTNEVCAAVSESTRRVVSGEIVQTLRRGSINVTLADYHRIIDLKTAELFRVSCHLGSKLAGSPPAYVDAAAHFGRHLGIAYQIYDDLADYFGDEAKIGKTLGTDLESGKLTLPLITLMSRLPEEARPALVDEILGRQPVRLAVRLEQMNEFGVFAAVAEAIEKEISIGLGNISDWPDEPPTALLSGLSEVLRSQVAALRPNS